MKRFEQVGKDTHLTEEQYNGIKNLSEKVYFDLRKLMVYMDEGHEKDELYKILDNADALRMDITLYGAI